MKHGMETLCGLQYTLGMMGIPIDGPSYIYGENMLVIHKTQQTESPTRRKSNSIYYHAMREKVAMGELLTNYIPTGDNCVDSLTKVLYERKGRYHMINLL